MNVFFAMVKKDLQLLFTDKVTLFFTFVFPLLFAALFGNMMGGGGGSNKISVALVQGDTHQASTQFLDTLQQSPELKTELMTLEAAKESVRKGEKVAFIYLPEGFGEKFDAVFAGKAPEIIMGVDPKRTAESGLLQGVLMKYGAERFQNAFSNPLEMRKQLQTQMAALDNNPAMPEEWRKLLSEYLPKMDSLLVQNNETTFKNSESEFEGFVPLKVKEESIQREQKGPTNTQAVFFPQALLWAILGCIMGFGTSLVQENSKGTMLRMQVAPISALSIILGKALTCGLTILVVSVFLVTIGHFVYGMPIQSVPKLILAFGAMAVCFSGLMMMLAAIAKTEQALNGMGWAVMMIFAMIGGAMLPLFLMPEWLQQASHISPVKWGILALEGAVWRNFSLQEMALPVSVLLSIGVVCYGIGLQRFRSFTEVQ